MEACCVINHWIQSDPKYETALILSRVPVDNAVDDLAGGDVDARHSVHVVHGDGTVVVDNKAASLPAR